MHKFKTVILLFQWILWNDCTELNPSDIYVNESITLFVPDFLDRLALCSKQI